MNPFKLCAKDKELEKSSGVLVEIKKLDHFDESFELPSYETNGSAGCDLKASLHNEDRKSGLRLIPNECITIPTGLCMAIPKGYEIQVRPRSGMSLKTKLRIPNSPGTIDSDYRGEIKVILENIGGESIVIEHGDRIAQLVLVKVPQAQFREVSEELSKTDRGEGGFGSTGVK
ncbi:MAG: dUTP diphosphatase [Oligoflexia bacterium]|nr:dUTP diphosphatase [Oligoflexia bacterium]